MTDTNSPPVKKLRRYFFGWHLVNGIPFAMKWAEDDGMVVGGIPNVVGEVMEITEEQFSPNVPISELEKEHPFPVEIPVKEITPPPEPEPI